MMIGARTAAWAKSGGWVNPYQTADNAIVAMWDGEWNAGGGIHDSATVPRDLIGANHMTIGNGNPSIMSKSVQLTASDSLWLSEVSGVKAFELVYKQTTNAVNVLDLNSDVRFFCINDSRGISLNAKVRRCFNPANKIGNVYSYSANVYPSDESKLYQNGVDILLVANSIGSYYSHAGINAGTSYHGSIEFFSLRVYDRALTTAEIAANYAIDKARFGLT